VLYIAGVFCEGRYLQVALNKSFHITLHCAYSTFQEHLQSQPSKATFEELSSMTWANGSASAQLITW